MPKITDILTNDIQACKQCITIICHKKFPAKTHGNKDSDYMLLSEAPGKESLIKGKYWTGIGGSIFRDCCKKAGVELEELFYLTDIVKCWPNKDDKNRPPLNNEIETCSEFLKREIFELNPKLILSFGKSCSEYLLGRKVKMDSEHGKIYSHGSSQILILYHPTNINWNMDRAKYINQISALFSLLKNNDLKNITAIF